MSDTTVLYHKYEINNAAVIWLTATNRATKKVKMAFEFILLSTSI